MSEKELQEIIDSHKWIKVRRYEKPSEVTDWQFEHEMLSTHHRDETEFLIEKCRELAKELIETQKKVPWSQHKPHVDEWGNSDWRDTGEMGVNDIYIL